MKLIYGTGNAAKLHVMREALHGLPIELEGLQGYPMARTLAIEENGDTPLQNARIKAHAYYDLLGQPVFSCDSGLYFDGLPDALQPGVHARRVNGKTLNDEEMLAYYGGLARKYGTLRARYRNGICLYLSANTEVCCEDDSLCSAWFGIAETQHEGWMAGFPIDALSVRLSDGTPYLELGNEYKQMVCDLSGFRSFFAALIKNGTLK